MKELQAKIKEKELEVRKTQKKQKKMIELKTLQDN